MIRNMRVGREYQSQVWMEIEKVSGGGMEFDACFRDGHRFEDTGETFGGKLVVGCAVCGNRFIKLR